MKKAFTMKSRRCGIQEMLGKAVGFWRENGVSGQVIHDAQLVLEEVVTNIIEHGFAHNGEHEIEIETEITERFLLIETRDDAEPFDPTRYDDPDLKKPADERRIGGLGILLVRRLMDGTAYRRDGITNVLMIKKRLI